MKLMHLAVPAIAVGALSIFLLPAEVDAFALNGSSLGQAQRDFRIFNNFSDAQANNNQNPSAQFPGYFGAVLCIWKASVEWGSELHGTGGGDPHQGNQLGSGGANFDPSFQGEATQVGNTDSNTHSELSGNGGSVFAFAEGPYSNGWRVRYYSDPWTWRDGPNNEGGTDIQGIATHEYGHCIGLNHSAAGGATMLPSTATGIEQRSINNDDSAGVQAIYGVKSASKPRITGVSVNAGILTLTGVNFEATGNTIWFTQAGSGGTGEAVKVSNISSTGGGTQIVVGIPGGAGPGDVLVRATSGNAGLSNAMPVDPGGGMTGGGLTITSIDTPTLEAITVDGPPLVNLFGSGFLDTTGITVDGIALQNFPPEYGVLSDSQIVITNWPFATQLGAIDVTVTGTTGNDTIQVVLTENSPPAFNLVGSQSESGFLFTATGLQLQLASGPGDVHFLAFSGQNVPSSFPGYVNWSIGNNFFNLFNLGSYNIPASGYVNVNLPVSGSLGGVIIYMQSAAIDVSTGMVFPLVMTNTQSGQFLF